MVVRKALGLALLAVSIGSAALARNDGSFQGADYIRWNGKQRLEWLRLTTGPSALRVKACLDEMLTARNAEERLAVDMYARSSLSELTLLCAAAVAGNKR